MLHHNLVTADSGGVIRLQQLGTNLDQEVGRHDHVTALAMSEGGQFVASGDVNGVIRVWPNPPSLMPAAVLNPHDGLPVNVLGFIATIDRFWLAPREAWCASGSLLRRVCSQV